MRSRSSGGFYFEITSAVITFIIKRDKIPVKLSLIVTQSIRDQSALRLAAEGKKNRRAGRRTAA